MFYCDPFRWLNLKAATVAGETIVVAVTRDGAAQ